MVVSIKYEPVKVTVKKSGICLCGKRITRQKTFEQTISPFNKDATGKIRTPQEIYKEVSRIATEWKGLPVRHDCASGYFEWTNSQREQYDKGENIKVKLTCGYEDIICKNI